MTDKPIGRPPAVTKDVLNKLEEAFALGCTDLEACFYAGISDRVLYLYQEKNPEFVHRKQSLKEQPVLKARKVVVDAIDDGDKQTSQWYLERKKKEEFSTKTESKTDLQHLDKDGKPTDPPSLSDQQIIERYLQQKEPTK